MSKTYFISDTHFHHKNILKYEPSRIDYLANYIAKVYKEAGAAEDIKVDIQKALDMNIESAIEVYLNFHDQMLIDEWNKVVKDADTVWFLGDFAFGCKERAMRIAAQLKGHKRMVRGNHDNWPDEFYRQIGFEYVSKYPVVLKQFFILSHAPMLHVANTPFFNIFGHVHSSPLITTHSENGCCVCVERHDLRPIRITEFDNAQ